MENSFSSIVKNTLLSVASICISLVILEIVLPFLDIRAIEESVYEIRRPVIQYQYGAFHPQLKYTLQNNLRNVRQYYPGKLDYTVDTNSQGFRGDEWDMSPTRRNIFLLGDSFAFGWGVQWNETAGELIEKELQKIDPEYQVINLAQSGYSIKEVVNSYEFYKDQLKPEAIIYIFCQNDLESYSPPVSQGIFDIAYHPKENAKQQFEEMLNHNQPGYWSWNKFRRGSYLHAFYARFVRPIISKRIRNSLHIDPPPKGFDFPPPISPPTVLPNSPEKDFLFFCLNKIANSITGNFLLIDTSDKADLLRKDSATSKRWMLKKFAAKNVQFINFENIMRTTPGSRKYFLDHDDHWSPKGHSKAAELLIETIQKNH